MPHIGHNNDAIRQGSTYIERMKRSYSSLDSTIKLVMDCLHTNNLLDDTIIIGYGDHGDDKWTRSINNGFTHTIEPYLNVIKTPAFIYDKRIKPEVFRDTVSMIDLKQTALYLLDINHEESFPQAGINVFVKKNQYVYSRNLLTNQRLTETIEDDWMAILNENDHTEHKNKAFSIINEDYNLIVSCHGIEMYMHQTDPYNYNNLLNFFELDTDGDPVRFDNHGAWRGHFRSIMMADDQLYHIIYNYHLLRSKLKRRLEEKYSRIETEENNFLDWEHFNHVRERKYIYKNNGSVN